MKWISFFLCGTVVVHAQLAVTVLQPKTTGQRAVVELTMKNSFTNTVESARAICFLFDDQSKMAGQSTKWVIGGTKERPGLLAGGTNTFNFVITSPQPFTTTNLTAKVSFNRIVLSGGQIADVNKAVQIENPNSSPLSPAEGISQPAISPPKPVSAQSH